MGRNRIPTAIQDAKGAFLKDPQRARPDEPTSNRPLGSPPKYLTKEQKKVWKELSAQLLPGVAFESDRTMFELLVRLKEEMINRYAGMRSADKSLLKDISARFAMSPSDRSKVSVEAPKEGALDKFLRKLPTPQQIDESQLAN